MARVLQLVNSVWFAGSRAVGNLEDAVRRLGFRTLGTLALALRLDAAFETAPGLPSAAEVSADGMVVGRVAAALIDDPETRSAAFAAGMLHDVGLLVLGAQYPERLAADLEAARERSVPLYQVEEEVRGVDHAVIGAALLAKWGVPEPVVEAVANHHVPQRVSTNTLGVVGAVHVANHLVETLKNEPAPAPLNTAWLAAHDLADRVEEWRAKAESIMSS